MKPFHWTKQKIDKKINGEFVFKSRDSLESLVYPTAKIISDVGIGDTILYLDNASFFNYEERFWYNKRWCSWWIDCRINRLNSCRTHR